MRNNKPLIFHTHKVYHGQDGWEQWDEPLRRDLLQLMADFLVAMEIPLVYACVDKKKMVARYNRPINPRLMTFVQCGEIIERWTRGHANDHMWIPCVGSNDFNRDIERLFVDCRHHGSPFGYWTRTWEWVTDVMAFTTPENSELFLLADFCTWVFSRERQEKDCWGLGDVIRPLVYSYKLFPR